MTNITLDWKYLRKVVILMFIRLKVLKEYLFKVFRLQYHSSFRNLFNKFMYLLHEINLKNIYSPQIKMYIMENFKFA